MKYATTALILTLFLSGCTAAHFNGLACPDVTAYTPASQLKVEAELRACTACPETIEYMKDYGVMRDQARACAE